jgi:hypothetical protein
MTPKKDYERLIDDGFLLNHHEISLNGREFFSHKYN